MAVVPGVNRYCGPFAVGYCADVSPDILDDGPMTALEVHQALNKRGIHCALSANYYSRSAIDRPTIAAWAKTRNPSALQLIVTSDHIAVVDGGVLYDNNNRAGVRLADYNHRRNRIVFVMEVQRIQYAKAA